MDDTKICDRCRGCGQIVGYGARERPWSRLEGIPLHDALDTILGVQRPSPCPSCRGAGSMPARREPAHGPGNAA